VFSQSSQVLSCGMACRCGFHAACIPPGGMRRDFKYLDLARIAGDARSGPKPRHRNCMASHSEISV
jgi:hypothetical protein